MENWPPLSQASDGPTIAMLHLVAQMIGKVPTALLPWRNHGWHLTLHLTPRGLGTELVHAGPRCFDLTLDMVEHRLVLGALDAAGSVALPGKSIAQAHGELLAMLGNAGLPISFHPAPNEVEPATPFSEDVEPRH
jgi:hypothetical protein